MLVSCPGHTVEKEVLFFLCGLDEARLVHVYSPILRLVLLTGTNFSGLKSLWI